MKTLMLEGDSARAQSVRAAIHALWPDSEIVSVPDGQALCTSAQTGVDLVVVGCASAPADVGEVVAAMTDQTDAPIVVSGSASDLPAMVGALEAGASDYLVLAPEAEGLVRAVLQRSADALGLRREMDVVRRRVRGLQAQIADKDRQIRNMARQTQDLSPVDPLTELSNRRHFSQRLRTELERTQRYQFPISCLMVDLDHLRHINNSYGFDAGDDAMARIAEILLHHARRSDVVSRYGAEEFALLFPHTPKDGAVCAAERIRQAVAEEEFGLPGQRNFSMTVSVGVAAFPDPDLDSADHLVDGADKALRQAKAEGRNRVCVLGADPRLED